MFYQLYQKFSTFFNKKSKSIRKILYSIVMFRHIV